MISSELGYTQEQVVEFWTKKLAAKTTDKTNYWEGQVFTKREELNSKFNELEALKIKKSLPIDEIEACEVEIEKIKDDIIGVRAKIEKIKADNELRLQNITEHWNTTILVQAGNFSGNPIYFFMPYGADATLDFNHVIVTYLGQPLLPTIIPEDEALASGVRVSQQLIISTGGKMTV
jgi:hypothetical protein